MTWAIFSDDHTRAIEEMAKSGSDRVIAIVGGAILDNTLHRTLSERFRKDEDAIEKLLKVGGPLGNTEPKADVLFLLSDFDKSIKYACWGITRVRNFFAHNLRQSFNSQDPKFVEAINLMRLHDGRTHYPHHLFKRDTELAIEKVNNNRDRYVVNLQLCLLFLMRDRASHETWSNVPLPEAKLLEQMERERKEREAAAKS